jgi:hypothetical protein
LQSHRDDHTQAAHAPFGSAFFRACQFDDTATAPLTAALAFGGGTVTSAAATPASFVFLAFLPAVPLGSGHFRVDVVCVAAAAFLPFIALRYDVTPSASNHPLHLDNVCEVGRLPMQSTELTGPVCVGHSVCVPQAGGFDKLDTCTASSYIRRSCAFSIHSTHNSREQCFQQIPAGAQSLEFRLDDGWRMRKCCHRRD